jgi:hypothetical protein
MLKLPSHSGFQDLFLNYTIIIHVQLGFNQARSSCFHGIKQYSLVKAVVVVYGV